MYLCIRWLIALCPITAAAATTVPAPNVPVCPPSYLGTTVPLARHYNSTQLGSPGPTPAGIGIPGKCDITTVMAATANCPAGNQSHYAYDYFNFWSDNHPPINRVFRQEMHIDSYLGIPVGERLKFAEVSFMYGESVRFYFDRTYSWYSDVSVTYAECAAECNEIEVDRFNFPAGLPLAEAVPVTLTWTTGRHQQSASYVAWTFGRTFPDTPLGQGSVSTTSGTREVSFSNGLVNGSCASTPATHVSFISPRFEAY